MSTYLLLRNNKETGPHSLEDLRGLSLKAYDLVWVEGKSAAWRYPGEINELKSFAPEVVEQPFDRFFKKPPETSATPAQETPPVKQADHRAYTPPPAESFRPKASRSVYINMPAAAKNNVEPRTVTVPPPAFSESLTAPSPEPVYVSPLLPYSKAPARKSLKIPLLIAAIILLFGTGIVTGYLLSNRGIYSSGIARRKAAPVRQPVIIPVKQVIETERITTLPVAAVIPVITETKPDPAAHAVKIKKDKLPAVAKKSDTILQEAPAATTAKEAVSNKRAPAQAPENVEEYVTVKAGKYSVGTFGGITNVQLSVNNEATVPLDLVVVEVQYIQSNKKVFKTENVYFHNVAAGAALEHAAPNSPRGVKIKYRISMVNAKQLNYSFTDM